jgi:hypothetical protein
VREHLYNRGYFAKDGVATNLNKLFLQQYLAEFARHAYFDRKRRGFDLIDRFGEHAGFYMQPSSKLGRMASSYALMALKSSQINEANLFADIASKEHFNFRSIIVHYMARISKYRFGRSLVSSVLKAKTDMSKKGRE